MSKPQQSGKRCRFLEVDAVMSQGIDDESLEKAENVNTLDLDCDVTDQIAVTSIGQFIRNTDHLN